MSQEVRVRLNNSCVSCGFDRGLLIVQESSPYNIGTSAVICRRLASTNTVDSVAVYAFYWGSLWAIRLQVFLETVDKKPTK